MYPMRKINIRNEDYNAIRFMYFLKSYFKMKSNKWEWKSFLFCLSSCCVCSSRAVFFSVDRIFPCIIRFFGEWIWAPISKWSERNNNNNHGSGTFWPNENKNRRRLKCSIRQISSTKKISVSSSLTRSLVCRSVSISIVNELSSFECRASWTSGNNNILRRVEKFRLALFNWQQRNFPRLGVAD